VLLLSTICSSGGCDSRRICLSILVRDVSLGEYLVDSVELVRPLHHWVFEASRGWAVQAAERVSGDGVILGPRVECHLQLFNKCS